MNEITECIAKIRWELRSIEAELNTLEQSGLSEKLQHPVNGAFKALGHLYQMLDDAELFQKQPDNSQILKEENFRVLLERIPIPLSGVDGGVELLQWAAEPITTAQNQSVEAIMEIGNKIRELLKAQRGKLTD